MTTPLSAWPEAPILVQITHPQEPPSGLLTNLRSLWSDELYLDARLVTPTGSVYCHRLVLASASPFFRELLLSIPEPEDLADILLPEMSFTEVQILVSCLYGTYASEVIDWDLMSWLMTLDIGVKSMVVKLAPSQSDLLDEVQDTSMTFVPDHDPQGEISMLATLSDETTQTGLLQLSKEPLPKNFLARDSLDLEHKDTVVSLTSGQRCSHCGKSFKSLSAFSQHKQIHEQKDVVFKCELCHVTFGTQRYLYQHTKRKHNSDPKTYQCEVCHKVLAGREELKGHMRLHTGSKPFLCAVCEQRFRNRSTLNNHLKMHNKNRKEICHQCGKRFIQKGDLRKHLRTHTQEKPYKCPTCGRCFARADYLSKHAKMHKRPKAETDFPKMPPELGVDEIACTLMDGSILADSVALSGLSDGLVLEDGSLTDHEKPEGEALSNAIYLMSNPE